MQANTLDEEAVQLLAFAKDIVTILGARRMEAPRILRHCQMGALVIMKAVGGRS